MLRAEKILKERGLAHELVPVPRNLSSDCGMCVKLKGDLNLALASFAGLDIAGCHDGDGNIVAPPAP